MLLQILIVSSIISCLHIGLLNSTNINRIKNLSLAYSGFIVLVAMVMFVNFDLLNPILQFTFNYNWILLYNYNLVFGVDSLSLFFILLSNLLIFLSLLGSYSSITFDHKKYFVCFLLINLLLILVFSVRDVFFFLYLF